MFLFISMFSCVERIDFPENQSESLIVVDGTYSATPGVQRIKLSSSIPVNRQVNEPISQAKVFVEDNLGNRIPFLEMEEGSYESQTPAVIGNTYRLYAELPDGRTIHSNYQEVPDSFQIKEIKHVDTLATFLNESGSTQRLKSIEFYAVAEQETVQEDFYLRFQYETAYQVLETKCSPFHNPKACYFYNDERPFDLNLFEIEAQTGPVSFESLVLRRATDYKLAELFALDLYLYNYNKEEFEYWKQLKQLFDQSGNVTDAIPARLIGNIVADDGSEVLGQFAVVGKTRKIKLIGNSDFPTYKLPFCGIAGLRPWPLPDECCNCLGLKGATTIKPDYWP